MYMKIGSRECQGGLENRKETSQTRLPRSMVSREKRIEKGARLNLLMGNDRAWEAGFAGRAWVGHIADRGVGVEGRLEEWLVGFQERGEKLCAG